MVTAKRAKVPTMTDFLYLMLPLMSLSDLVRLLADLFLDALLLFLGAFFLRFHADEFIAENR